MQFDSRNNIFRFSSEIIKKSNSKITKGTLVWTYIWNSSLLIIPKKLLICTYMHTFKHGNFERHWPMNFPGIKILMRLLLTSVPIADLAKYNGAPLEHVQLGTWSYMTHINKRLYVRQRILSLSYDTPQTFATNCIISFSAKKGQGVRPLWYKVVTEAHIDSTMWMPLSTFIWSKP